MTQAQHPRLVAGQVFKLRGLPSQRYRVVRVGSCSATVQALGSRHVTMQTQDGEVAFDAPGRRFEISTSAAGVCIVEEGEP